MVRRGEKETEMNKSHDVICPYCGAVNRELFLDETDGVMECEECGQVVKVVEFEGQKTPICILSGSVTAHRSTLQRA